MRISDWSSDVCSSDLACAPCGQSIAGDVDAAEQLRPLQTVKIERQGFAVVDDAERDDGLAVGQICQFAGRQDFHLDFRMEAREIGKVRHEQMTRKDRDRKSKRPNSNHTCETRMPYSA